MAWKATRLFPSTNGWFFAIPNPYEAASEGRSEVGSS